MLRTFGRLLALVLLLVIAAEVALRVTPRSLAPQLRLLDRVYTARSAWTQMMAGDPYLGYKLKPDLDFDFPSEGRKFPFRTVTYGLGDIGFRDLGMQPPFPLVAVGGSFTVCDDVPAETCWVRALSHSLGVSGATLGVNGYSSLAAARMLERYGERLNPRLVLVELHPNDFRDNVLFDRWSRLGNDNFWDWLGRKRGRTPVVRWLSRNSMIYRLYDGLNRGAGRPIYNFQERGLDMVFRFDTWFLNVVRQGDQHPGWPLTQRSLIQLRDLASNMGAEMMVILFPTKEQAYWDDAQKMAPPDISVAIDRPIELVSGFCKEQGIHCCDLRQPFRQAARGPTQIYHRISAHPNDAGNALTAAAVEACLREQHVTLGGNSNGVQE